MKSTGLLLIGFYTIAISLSALAFTTINTHFRSDPTRCLAVTQQGSSVLCVTKTHKVTTLATITTTTKE